MKIEIFGHQRSGTHYVALLISKNFLNSNNYLKLYSSKVHHYGNTIINIIKRNPNVKGIVVLRNWNDVSVSLWKFRERLGLHSETFDKFLNTKYNTMWNKGKCNIKIFGPAKEELRSMEKHKGNTAKVSSFFAEVSMKPRNYYDLYYSFWINLANKNKNVYIINYDNLQKDFINEMKGVSSFLEVKREKFENIETPVGWYEMERNGLSK